MPPWCSLSASKPACAAVWHTWVCRCPTSTQSAELNRLVAATLLVMLPEPAGANLAVDVTWKYLNFFMSDDKKLKHIETEYGSGRMLTGEAKAELIKVQAQHLVNALYCKHCSHVICDVCIYILLSMSVKMLQLQSGLCSQDDSLLRHNSTVDAKAKLAWACCNVVCKLS